MRANVIETVLKNSPAADAGLRSGDQLQTLNDVPIHSFADAQFALDRAPKQGKIRARWVRDQETVEGEIKLPANWRRTDIGWRPSLRQFVAQAQVYGKNLSADEKESLGLARDQLAFRQNDEVQENADGQLIAFDGFENLAGKIRRGRSGFGWAGGWQPPGRRRNVGTIVDAPDDEVFGLKRASHRVLKLSQGAVIQRELEHPLFAENRSDVYVSLLLLRRVELDVENSSFQFKMTSGESGRRSRRDRTGIGFGLTSNSSPYVKNGGVINDVGIRIPNEVVFLVAHISANDKSEAQIRLRVYRKGDDVDKIEPDEWTTSSPLISCEVDLAHIMLSSGSNGDWEIDQVRIGETWSSVTTNE